MKKLALLATALILTATAPMAFAQDDATVESSDWFTTADVDGNGSISHEEFMAVKTDHADEATSTAEFETLDTDADGSISMEEATVVTEEAPADHGAM